MTYRIYVECLASRNNGDWHGDWVDLDQSESGVWEDIKAILQSSPVEDAEDWVVSDYEMAGLEFGENPDITKLVEITEKLEEHGEAYAAYLDLCGEDADQFCDYYEGEAESKEAFVQNYMEALGEIPSYLWSYIDWEKMARDYFTSDFSSYEWNGKLYIFRA